MATIATAKPLGTLNMNPKYSNIFWHQGVKVFEENILNSPSGQMRVDHLENDVTKSLLNLFQHCSPKVFRAFLQMIGVKQAPEAFKLEFQVTDTESYRRKPTRIMLCIVSTSTVQKASEAYKAIHSIPDACLHSQDTAILIESKTQSPLIREQIQSHIDHYLGTATQERTITWEDISEKLRLVSGELNGQDLFLVTQFREFLDLIGISEFNGFSEMDFEMLGALGRIPDEDFVDFKRLFHRKTEKFMALLKAEVEQEYAFKPFKSYVSRLIPNMVGTFSGFNFFDDDPNLHNNYYPNININYMDHSVELSFNAETQPSVKCVLACMNRKADKMDAVLSMLQELRLIIYYKIQYQPKNHFIWNPIPGFPRLAGTFKVADVINDINDFENKWSDFKNTCLYEMESGRVKHSSDRLFSENERHFAEDRNPRPNYAIRFSLQYPISNIAVGKKKAVQFFKQEILKLRPLVELVLAGCG